MAKDFFDTNQVFCYDAQLYVMLQPQRQHDPAANHSARPGAYNTQGSLCQETVFVFCRSFFVQSITTHRKNTPK